MDSIERTRYNRRLRRIQMLQRRNERRHQPYSYGSLIQPTAVENLPYTHVISHTVVSEDGRMETSMEVYSNSTLGTSNTFVPSPQNPSLNTQFTNPEEVRNEIFSPEDNNSDTSSDSGILQVQNHNNTSLQNATRKFLNVWDFGEPSYACHHCGAIMWYEERTIKSYRPTFPKFSLCCREGQVQLPLLKEPPEFLKQLLDYNGGSRSRKFRENIRAYNSIFAFTSMGGCIDNRINNGRGPYVFRINGQNHHKIGSLLPLVGARLSFAQLYIYDTGNEVNNRIAAFNSNDREVDLDPYIINGLKEMLDQYNPLAKVFRMARDRFHESNYAPVRLRLIESRARDGRQYNLPTASEVAALIVGDGQQSTGNRDVIVEERTMGLKRITELHPNFTALQYPILFPYGKNGFRMNIHRNVIQT